MQRVETGELHRVETARVLDRFGHFRQAAQFRRAKVDFKRARKEIRYPIAVVLDWHYVLRLFHGQL